MKRYNNYDSKPISESYVKLSDVVFVLICVVTNHVVFCHVSNFPNMYLMNSWW